MTRSAREIREEIIATVLRNGGHLASSLGAVELSMALAEAFDPERDRVVWDVGHQAYAWKILTGRGGRFGSIRTLGGLSPFLDPAESPADAVANLASSAYVLNEARPWISGDSANPRRAAVMGANFDAINPVGTTFPAGRAAVVILEEEPEDRT